MAKHADAVELRVVAAQYSPSPPMPCSSHTTSQYLLPIWVPHWPACMLTILREKNSQKVGSTREKKAGRSGKT
jgi:hypothetical protein